VHLAIQSEPWDDTIIGLRLIGRASPSRQRIACSPGCRNGRNSTATPPRSTCCCGLTRKLHPIRPGPSANSHEVETPRSSRGSSIPTHGEPLGTSPNVSVTSSAGRPLNYFASARLSPNSPDFIQMTRSPKPNRRSQPCRLDKARPAAFTDRHWSNLARVSNAPRGGGRQSTLSCTELGEGARREICRTGPAPAALGPRRLS
jgi:hypothetical protein